MDFPFRNLKWWEQPELGSLNKLPARATFTSFPSLEEAAAERREGSWSRSLNGIWQFRLAPNPAVALEWIESGDAGNLPPEAEIEVPGNWEMQGWELPHYTNVRMPWKNEPPTVPEENPTGIYRRFFWLPREWDGMRAVIHFGSADSLLLVFCNGHFVGLSKDSRLPAEFELSKHILTGEENELIAMVVKWSDASFLEDQDMWWLSGLAREVWLYATPQVYLADVFARPVLSEDCASGAFEVTVSVGHGPVLPPEPVAVGVNLFDAEDDSLLSEPIQKFVETRRSHVDHLRGKAWFRIEVPPDRLRLWSAEDPHRYGLSVSVTSAGRECHTRLRIGLRRVEVLARDLLVNGKRVPIYGVNRHEHDDRRGRAVTREMMRRDICLMKSFNFNAVRCAHYPPDPHWLELCDELGLYVIDEANIETHDFHNQLCHDSRFAAAWLDRVMRMVLRDRNHPSIILWSLGNESGYGANHDAAAGWVRGTDSSRPLHYEGAISKWQSHLSYADGARVTDVICPMYPELEDLRTWARLVAQSGEAERLPAWNEEKWIAVAETIAPLRRERIPVPPLARPLHPYNRPVILCEYSHAMGNSNGSLADYFELFRTVPGLQGGFIWEWSDHGIHRTTDEGVSYWVYGGDFGDEPNDANFVCDGMVWPDRTPHPAMWEHKRLAQPVSISPGTDDSWTIVLRNEYSFVPLRGMEGRWSLLVDGEQTKSGRSELPALEPGESGVVDFLIGDFSYARGECHLNFEIVLTEERPWARVGHVLASAQWPLSQERLHPATRILSGVRKISERVPSLRDSKDHWILESPDREIALTLEKSTGRITSLMRGGDSFFVAGPSLQLWRAAVDNDGIKLWTGQNEKPLGRWRQLGLDRLKSRLLECATGDNEVEKVPELVVSKQASGRGKWDDFTFVYRICLTRGGVVRVMNELTLGSEELMDLPRVGIRLDFPTGFEGVRYFGRGPHENYVDRRSAADLGVFEETVDSMYVPYIMPQEHGHRTDARWVELSHSDGRKVRLSAADPFEFNISHFSAEELFAARHTTDLKGIPETIFYLDVAHRGVGTGSCGPDTLNAYRLRHLGYCWSYQIELKQLPKDFDS